MTTPPGRVDVELDVLVRVLALEEQELGDDDVRHVVVDGAAEEDDAVLQQPAEDVPGALAAVRRLDHVRVDDVVRDRAAVRTAAFRGGGARPYGFRGVGSSGGPLRTSLPRSWLSPG